MKIFQFSFTRKYSLWTKDISNHLKFWVSNKADNITSFKIFLGFSKRRSDRSYLTGGSRGDLTKALSMLTWGNSAFRNRVETSHWSRSLKRWSEIRLLLRQLSYAILCQLQTMCISYPSLVFYGIRELATFWILDLECCTLHLGSKLWYQSSLLSLSETL